ncbi:MAG: translation elongation factor Ts [Candidatus Phytoplasma stylosanthis]|nr:translation elongation factor Ts [Candidatus Phytoplasma stylosanthis]
MKIKIELIKKLRDETQAGIQDCKKALEQKNGDFEAAFSLLREKSLFYFKNKKNKENKEGLTNVIVQDNKAILYELNAETDFVVLNKNFIELYDKIGEILLKAEPSIKTLNDFLNYYKNGQTVQEMILEKSFVIKEQISLSRIQVVYKKEKESFGFYKHQGGKISSLVHLENCSPDVQEHLPVHIVGMKPKFLSKETVEENFILEERKNLLQQIKQKNIKKPLNNDILNKIVDNSLNSIKEKNCLLEQPFYIDDKQKVKEYLLKNKTNVIGYYFFEVGQK